MLTRLIQEHWDFNSGNFPVAERMHLTGAKATALVVSRLSDEPVLSAKAAQTAQPYMTDFENLRKLSRCPPIRYLPLPSDTNLEYSSCHERCFLDL